MSAVHHRLTASSPAALRFRFGIADGPGPFRG
jgi:hypothetical protein